MTVVIGRLLDWIRHRIDSKRVNVGRKNLFLPNNREQSRNLYFKCSLESLCPFIQRLLPLCAPYTCSVSLLGNVETSKRRNVEMEEEEEAGDWGLDGVTPGLESIDSVMEPLAGIES